MKKLTINKLMLIAALLLVGLAFDAYAYEVQDNPDRRISIGLNYDRTSLNGEYKFAGTTIKDFSDNIQNAFIADLRLPISGFCTLNVHGGYLNMKNTLFTNEEVSSGGYDVGAGVRFYLK